MTITVGCRWVGGAGRTDVYGPGGRAAPTWWTQMEMTASARSAWESTWTEGSSGHLEATLISSE